MEINNKQCADSALCTSTEEWINAAAKAMADVVRRRGKVMRMRQSQYAKKHSLKKKIKL